MRSLVLNILSTLSSHMVSTMSLRGLKGSNYQTHAVSKTLKLREEIYDSK